MLRNFLMEAHSHVDLLQEKEFFLRIICMYKKEVTHSLSKGDHPC